MKKALKISEYYHLINHGPCVVVSSGSVPKNEINVSSIAWLTPLNDDPALVIICVASTHYTSKLISKYKEFAINIFGGKHLKTIKICGSVSGTKENKFKKAGITALKGKKTSVPVIKEALATIECALYNKKEYDGINLFIGKVLHAEVEKDLYKSHLNTAKARTPHHLGNGLFVIDGKNIKI
ncbi:MAG: hypothetical protein A2252_12605 [Elusimicrobia bacterium RIFOXYA2_FULL_39_19]|nr:MAG: hypothetical protein A2252_12605 [Elusimicrobia bacterium RIFOXYA2_FULL_39_19]